MIDSNIIIYQNENGNIKVDVKFEDETLWLSQTQICEVFGKAKSTINEHIKNIFKDEELIESEVIQKFGNSEFQQKAPNYYNLDTIISVGYRVKSIQGVRFRQWATKRLQEYIIKGFTMDDERLKNPEQAFGKDYFKEQLERIRDIRSSERRFYQQITDIYSECSIDYDKDSQYTKDFFATVQNKLHWAITNQTASENRIATMYLDYAENQAQKQIPMTMNNWSTKLNAFLEFNEYDILQNTKKVTAKIAKESSKFCTLSSFLLASSFVELITSNIVRSIKDSLFKLERFLRISFFLSNCLFSVIFFRSITNLLN